jgi:hypothetical protein
MARVTAWTLGLFGAGAAIARAWAAPWTEPVVLLALGLAFLFVSARASVRPARPVAKLQARAPAPVPAKAAATTSAPVEQSA